MGPGNSQGWGESPGPLPSIARFLRNNQKTVGTFKQTEKWAGENRMQPA